MPKLDLLTRDELADAYGPIGLWDGCDRAFLGVAIRCGKDALAVYDPIKLVNVFMKQGMSVDEAEEWVQFNLMGAWVGARTPLTLNRLRLVSLTREDV